ncbi:MAG: hypothetical protein WCV58_03690 [Patescibacteria group bacterium]|jgi:hypothetical protein
MQLKKEDLFFLQLLAGKQLNVSEWVEVIDRRVKMIKPHLNRFTLQTIGDIEIPGPSQRDDFTWQRRATHNINTDQPTVLFGAYSLLSTQGIFFVSKLPDLLLTPEQPICHAYGLTRQGRWVIIEIKCDFKGERIIKANKQVISFEATKIRVTEINTILLVINSLDTCFNILDNLSKTVNGWLERLEESQQELKNLSEVLYIQDSVLGVNELL